MPALQSPWLPSCHCVYVCLRYVGSGDGDGCLSALVQKKNIERKEMDLCDNLTYVGLAFYDIRYADRSYLGKKEA